MSWQSIEFQPFVCLSGITSFPILQDQENWLKVGDFPGGVLNIQVSGMRGCTLVVEGADAVAGPWTTIQAVSASTTPVTCDEQYFLDRDAPQGTPERLPYYLRWRLDSAGSTDWVALFNLGIIVRD